MNYRLVSYLNDDIMSLLDSLPLIESEYITPNSTTIPLLESREFNNRYIVRYSGLENLAEEYNITIDESINLIAKSNNISKKNIIVAIEESRPYYDTDILYRFFNEYVLIPEINTPAYLFCEVCMEAFLETKDESWLDFYICCPENLIFNEVEFKYNSAQQLINQGIPAVYAMKFATISDPKEQYKAVYDYRKEHSAEVQKNYQIMVDRQNKTKGTGTVSSNSLGYDANKKYTVDPAYDKNLIKQDDSNSSTTNNRSPDTSNQPQSWLSKKWSAFKNWWGNVGTPNGDNGKGGGGWFSNLVGKIKSGLGIQPQQQAKPADTTPSQATTNTTPQTPATTTVSNEPAKPAQPTANTSTPQQQDAASAKQKAQEQNQANIANYNEKKRQDSNR